jgi:hypothetical protein
MDITRLIVTLYVIAAVDLDEVAERDGLDPAEDNVLGHYAGQLAGFLENEVNNCPTCPGRSPCGQRPTATPCSASSAPTKAINT